MSFEDWNGRNIIKLTDDASSLHVNPIIATSETVLFIIISAYSTPLIVLPYFCFLLYRIRQNGVGEIRPGSGLHG